MPVRAVAKVGSKGRLYLPPEVRDMLKVTEGDFLVFREEKGRASLRAWPPLLL